jgi:membrane-bound hydrogenase subunit beta
MTIEEGIVKNLINDFKYLDEKCSIPKERRIIVEVPQEAFIKVIEYMKSELSFTMLITITGLDLGEELQAIYHLAMDKGVVLNLKVNVPKLNPVIETVTSIYQGASLYERELIDMFGFEIKDMPQGYRYPLPDWWPNGQYPLRKEWKSDSLKSKQRGDIE